MCMCGCLVGTVFVFLLLVGEQPVLYVYMCICVLCLYSVYTLCTVYVCTVCVQCLSKFLSVVVGWTGGVNRLYCMITVCTSVCVYCTCIVCT